MQRFVGIDLGREPVPDETTVCRFRHLLEQYDLGRPLFDEVQRHLAAKGLKKQRFRGFGRVESDRPSAPRYHSSGRRPRQPIELLRRLEEPLLTVE
jgi:IS5 family transposase